MQVHVDGQQRADRHDDGQQSGADGEDPPAAARQDQTGRARRAGHAVQSRRMTTRRSLGLVCLIATLHGLFFIWYQRPDWNTRWPDQEGYRRLGRVMADVMPQIAGRADGSQVSQIVREKLA